jgi:hypothetical protein
MHDEKRTRLLSELEFLIIRLIEQGVTVTELVRTVRRVAHRVTSRLAG